MNIASSQQVGQFLFGQYSNRERVLSEWEFRSFKMDKSETELKKDQDEAAEQNPYIEYSTPDLKKLLKERKLKVSGKKADLVERLMMYEAMPVKFDTLSEEELIDMCKSRGLSSDGKIDKLIDRLTQDSLFVQRMASEQDKREAEISTKKPSKWKEITIKSLGLTPTDFSPAGTPQVSAAVLRKLSGTNLFGDPKDAVYGTLYDHFKPHGEEAAIKACEAVGALAMVGQIDATITNFLVPLQTLADKNKRIHCSLNLNTETGRLSSRRPNLQNQPALEKDQYKIRDAFIAEPGNTLIVADYGQLELRLMAHMTNCESMIEAFRSGGCFHSRTAMGMYPYIADAVNKGDVLLEWDYSKGQPTVPLVKDQYGSERRKAKTLNFSIAYGKTVHGLAADWGITTEEAEKTLQAWYNDRPEVKEWQEKTRNMAKGLGFVRTIMGRYRILPNANERGPAGGHALRAAINSPIQGSAADIVMMAMIKLWRSEVLKEKGWKLLLQIHDEVILEGPKDTRDEALAEVIACMENPFDDKGLMPVSVHLDVDAKSEDSWYKAK
jgi:DNA polymerase I